MATKGMEEELTCPICMEFFCQPRRLRCGHSYCHKCIKDMIESRAVEKRGLHSINSRPLVCPECRDEITVDSVTEVEALPLDFKLTKMVECFQFMKTKSDSDDEDLVSKSENRKISASRDTVYPSDDTQPSQLAPQSYIQNSWQPGVVRQSTFQNIQQPGVGQQPTFQNIQQPGVVQQPTFQNIQQPGAIQRSTFQNFQQPGVVRQSTFQNIQQPGVVQQPTFQNIQQPGAIQRSTFQNIQLPVLVRQSIPVFQNLQQPGDMPQSSLQSCRQSIFKPHSSHQIPKQPVCQGLAVEEAVDVLEAERLAKCKLDAILVASDPSKERHRQMLGEKLFDLIQPMYPYLGLAERITGMFLELNKFELVLALESQKSFTLKVEEAVTVLNNANMADELAPTTIETEGENQQGYR